MEYFIVYGIGFLTGAIAILSAEIINEKRKNDKR